MAHCSRLLGKLQRSWVQILKCSARKLIVERYQRIIVFGFLPLDSLWAQSPYVSEAMMRVCVIRPGIGVPPGLDDSLAESWCWSDIVQ